MTRSLLAALVAVAATAVLSPAVARAQTPTVNLAPPRVLEAPNPAYLSALRPLIARGAVILPYDVDNGAASRSVVFVRVAAPLETVHRVINSPEDYPTFMPAVGSVEVLARQGRRTAFRFHLAAGPFNVSADAAMHAVSDHRVDIAITRSDFGASGTRWDLYPDGPGATLVAVTTWTDPSQGNWLIRQLAGANPWAPSGAAIVAETTLALGVKRRAENLAGAHLPVRPAAPSVRAANLAPPPPGPWMDVALTVNVMVLTLDANGALEQITALGATSVSPSSVIHRMEDVEHYAGVWSWMRNGTITGHPSAGSVRFRAGTAAPLAAQEGEFVRTTENEGRTVRLRGVSGAFAGEELRWDVVPNAAGTFVMLTTGTQESHVNWMQHALVERDAWVVPGLSAYWDVVTVRYGLAGLQ